MARSSNTVCFAAVAALAMGASACLTPINPNQSPGTISCKVVTANATVTIQSPCQVALDFGQVPLGQDVTAIVEVENPTATSVDIGAFRASLNPELSANTTALQQPILPGSNADIAVTFQPFQLGAVSSTLAIPTTLAGLAGAGASIDLTLAGQGFQSNLALSPAALDLGNTLLGTTTQATFTLTNNSSATIAGITSSVGGTDANLFTLTSVPASLVPGASAQVDVTFAPLVLETRAVAYATISGAGGSATLDLFGEPVDVALVFGSTQIDFGYVALGTTSIACTTASNQSNINVTISSLADFETAGGAFALSTTDGATPPNSTAVPVTISAGGNAQVCFSFSPTVGQQYQGQATLVTDDPSGARRDLTLTGWGGGPQISCTPSRLAFGQDPERVASTLSVVCANTGSASGANLQIGQLSVGSGVFTAQFDRNNPYPVQGLAPGQQTQIDVSYTPTGGSGDTGTLVIQSNGGSGAAVDIPLTGSGVALPPCQFQIVPAALDFGNVPSEESAGPLAFAILNTGASVCLVRDVGIADDRGANFHLLSTSLSPDPQTGWISVSPSGSRANAGLVVTVDFVPSATGRFTDTVGFVISNPGDSNQAVALQGSSQPTCVLVSPASLDFGDLGQNNAGAFCGPRSRSFSVFDGCATPLTIQSASIEAGPGQLVPQFGLSGATTPLTIQPGDPPTVFQVSFAPSYLGSMSAQLVLSDGTIETPVPLSGVATAESTQTETFTAGAKADVLFILDWAAGDALVADIPAFLDAAGSIDYRIAVTDDDDDPASASADFGRLLPCPTCFVEGPAPLIVSPSTIPAGSSTPDPAKALSGFLGSIVVNGVPGDEHLFNALLEAFQRAPREGVDFFRPGAFLAVVNTSKNLADDNSPLTEAQYLAYFESFFPAPGFFGWNLVGANPNISGDGLLSSNQLPPRLSQMLAATHGMALNTSDGTWAEALNGQFWSFASAMGTHYPLEGSPAFGDQGVSVLVDGATLEESASPGVANWVYDAATNAVDLTAPPPAGAALSVTYPVNCN